MNETVVVRTATGEKRMTKIDAVHQKLFERAMKGEIRAASELLKLYGKYVPNDPAPFEEDMASYALADQYHALFGSFGAGSLDPNDDIWRIPPEPTG